MSFWGFLQAYLVEEREGQNLLSIEPALTPKNPKGPKSTPKVGGAPAKAVPKASLTSHLRHSSQIPGPLHRPKLKRKVRARLHSLQRRKRRPFVSFSRCPAVVFMVTSASSRISKPVTLRMPIRKRTIKIAKRRLKLRLILKQNHQVPLLVPMVLNLQLTLEQVVI